MTTVASKPSQTALRSLTRPTNIVQQSWIMLKRNMIHTKRMPEMLSDVTVQPIMFVLPFAFVFGASIATTGGASYREFLLPGIQAQTIVFTAFVVASGITADVEKGVIDRFRSLPIRRSSVLIGRSVASLIHSSIGVVVMAITGLCIGWRIRGGVLDAVLAFVLILATSGFRHISVKNTIAGERHGGNARDPHDCVGRPPRPDPRRERAAATACPPTRAALPPDHRRHRTGMVACTRGIQRNRSACPRSPHPSLSVKHARH
jgi:hypothetical protein